MKLQKKYPHLGKLLSRAISLQEHLRSGTVGYQDGSWSTASAGEVGNQEMELASVRNQLQKMVDRIPEQELFKDLHLQDKEELLEQLAKGKHLTVNWINDQMSILVLGGKKIEVTKILKKSGDQFQMFYKVLGKDNCIYGLSHFPKREEWELTGFSLWELEEERGKTRQGK